MNYGFTVAVRATTDETGILYCAACQEEFLADEPGDEVPESLPAGALVLALIVHQVKHQVIDDQATARRSHGQAVDAALTELRRVITDTAGR